MSAAEVNVPLLRKAVEWAEAEAARPVELREWHQADWVVTPADREWRSSLIKKDLADGSRDISESEQALASKTTECGTCFCIAGYIAQMTDSRFAEGIWVGSKSIPEVAQKALGLEFSDANRLFTATNTIADIREIADELAGERL